MIVRRLEDLADTDREVVAPTFESRRLLLAEDGMGFSFHDTVLYAGTRTEMCYQHHREAVYCIDGTGTLTDLETGTVFDIGPGTVYGLDRHDRHVLEAKTDLRMMCVFTPPLTGPEVHDEDGAYPLLLDKDELRRLAERLLEAATNVNPPEEERDAVKDGARP